MQATSLAHHLTDVLAAAVPACTADGPARVLGLELSCTSPAFLTLLAVHVPAGVVAVVAGAVTAARRKGTRAHVRTGRAYLAALTVLFCSAVGLTVVRGPEDRPLVVLGGLAVISASAGWLARRRPAGHSHRVHVLGLGASYVLMLTAFAVDNGPTLPVWRLLPGWAFWVLPALVGLPMIVRSAGEPTSRSPDTPVRRGRARSRGRTTASS